ncbi:MAG: hypothetical protein IKF14_01530 [Atopobiaceae bacterium]|nr:hypothetical protein [Atopobiaceae bacterium]
MSSSTISVNAKALQAYADRLTGNALAIGKVVFSNCSSVSGSTASRMHDECASAYLIGAQSYRHIAQRDQSAIRQISSVFTEQDVSLARQFKE